VVEDVAREEVPGVASYQVDQRGGGVFSLSPLQEATVQIDAKNEKEAKERAVEKMKQKDWTVRKVRRRSWF
jgi:hypothetical protein